MYTKTTLDNGIRVITCPMTHTLSASVMVFIGTGSRYEKNEEAGVSHFIEHLCFKGTEEHPTPQSISEVIEGVGGILNGSTDQEMTILWAKVARPHLSNSINLLMDMLRKSRFDPEDVEKERQVILEELNMVKDSPQQWVDVLIESIVWPDHPLGRDIGGTKESISRISREAILDYMNNQYSPTNTVISVAGDVGHDEIATLLYETLSDWKPSTPHRWTPASDEQSAPRLKIEYRKTEQSHLCVALRGLPILHPDRHALHLLNIILGEGMSSRLFVELRENKGLAYSIFSYTTHFLDSGAITVYAGVDPSRSREAIAAIIEELHKIKEGVTDAELTKAKELTKGRLMLRMEETRSVASWVGGQESLMGRILTVDDVLKEIDVVSSDDVKRVAGQLLITEKLNLALVGPHRSEKGLQRLLRL